MRYSFFLIFLMMSVSACRQDAKTIENTSNDSTSAVSKTEKEVLKLYVQTSQGLTLYQEPSENSSKITTLAYKSPALEVLDTVASAGKFVAERFDDRNIEGDWLRVRTNDGKEGFVFGGYLSRYPPVEVFSSDVETLDQFYRIISPIKGEHEKTQQPHAYDGYIQHYADGALYDSAMFNAGSAQLLNIPPGKLGLEECFVMLRSLIFTRPEEVVSSFDSQRNAFVAVNETEGYVNLVVSQKPDKSLLVELSYPD